MCGRTLKKRTSEDSSLDVPSCVKVIVLTPMTRVSSPRRRLDEKEEVEDVVVVAEADAVGPIRVAEELDADAEGVEAEAAVVGTE